MQAVLSPHVACSAPGGRITLIAAANTEVGPIHCEDSAPGLNNQKTHSFKYISYTCNV